MAVRLASAKKSAGKQGCHFVISPQQSVSSAVHLFLAGGHACIICGDSENSVQPRPHGQAFLRNIFAIDTRRHLYVCQHDLSLLRKAENADADAKKVMEHVKGELCDMVANAEEVSNEHRLNLLTDEESHKLVVNGQLALVFSLALLLTLKKKSASY